MREGLFLTVVNNVYLLVENSDKHCLPSSLDDILCIPRVQPV